MRTRNIVFLLAAAVVLLGVAQFVVSYVQSFQTVQINLSKNVSVTVYKSGDNHDDPLDYATDKPIASITASEKLKLKKGSYVLVSRENPDIKKILQGFSLEDRSETLTIYVQYSDSKLGDILKQEGGTIRAAIRAQVPNLQSLYDISREKLYHTGDWYGALLTYKGPASQLTNDSLRLIAKKDGQNWKVVTAPPQIVFSIELYPDIPQDIIREVNNFL